MSENRLLTAQLQESEISDASSGYRASYLGKSYRLKATEEPKRTSIFFLKCMISFSIEFERQPLLIGRAAGMQPEWPRDRMLKCLEQGLRCVPTADLNFGRFQDIL